jgi:hypothetical protein
MQALSRHRRMFSNPGPPPPPEPVVVEDTNRILIAVRSQYKLRLRADDYLFAAISKMLNGELVRRRGECMRGRVERPLRDEASTENRKEASRGAQICPHAPHSL